MNKRVPAILFILILYLSFCISSYAEEEKLSGYDIIYEAEERYNGDTVITDTTMILIDSRKNKRVRQMKMFRKDFGENNKDEKSLSFFITPEDIKNTAYLSYEYDDENKEDDSWLYLPALKKVKRLASSDKSSSFMGSDFTYTDLKSSKREFWNYKVIKSSDLVDGHDCWVVEGVPKEGKKVKVLKETGYTKVNIWVRKDVFVKVKAKFWIKKGKRIKFYKASNLKKIDNIWTVMERQMITTKKGRVEHSTVMKTDKIVYNEELKDSIFTQQRMKVGM